jgi:hypothetical protein
MKKPAFGDPELIRQTYENEAAAIAAEDTHKKGLKLFRVTVCYESETEIEVEAESIQAAEEKAEEEINIEDFWDWDVSYFAVELAPEDAAEDADTMDPNQLTLPVGGTIPCSA